MPEVIDKVATKEEKEEFVIQAIKKLRDPAKSKGIHVRYSGFNEAFRLQFNEDARATTEDMAVAGTIVVIPAKGSVRLYLAAEAPVGGASGRDALAKILG